jgi:hypothetical protein
MASELMQQAYDSFRAGDRKHAVDLLTQLIQEEPKNVEAWYGLAICVQDVNLKIKCLRKVLTLNPDHAKAQKGLEQLVPPPPESASAEEIPSPNGSALVDAGGAQAAARAESFGETKTCPYCHTTIPGSATVCPNCFHALSGEVSQNLSELDKIDQQKNLVEAANERNATTLGVIALICGITGLCLLLPAIPAVFVGNMAARKGSGLGRIAAILGYIGIVFMVCSVVSYIVFSLNSQAITTLLLQQIPKP